VRWRTHKVVTAFIVWTLTHEPVATISAAAGSVFPDALEFFIYGSEVPRWKHRTFSHWMIPYLIMLPVFFLLTSYHHFRDFYTIFHSIAPSGFLEIFKNFNRKGLLFRLLFYILFWFTAGAVFHILEDAITGKVPSPFSGNYKKKKWGIKLFQTGSLTENAIFAVFSVLLILLIGKRFVF